MTPFQNTYDFLSKTGKTSKETVINFQVKITNINIIISNK